VADFNKYNPYPSLETIRCPRCGEAAEFRKAFALIDKKELVLVDDAPVAVGARNRL
jgi:hypothetical protein